MGRPRSFTIVAPPPTEADVRTVDATQTEALEAALETRIHAGWPDAVAALGP